MAVLLVQQWKKNVIRMCNSIKAQRKDIFWVSRSFTGHTRLYQVSRSFKGHTRPYQVYIAFFRLYTLRLYTYTHVKDIAKAALS